MIKYVSDALQNKARAAESDEAGEPPWMRGFGELADLHDETRRIDNLIAHEFSEIDPEDAHFDLVPNLKLENAKARR